MKIKNTIEYLKDMMNMSEEEVLINFGFERFIGAPNTDKLFQIYSSNGQWIIESAEGAQNQFGYVSCNTYSPIRNCSEKIDSQDFSNIEEYGIDIDNNEYFSLFKDGMIDCDGKTFDETKEELEDAYISMHVEGHTGSVGVYVGKDGFLHSYVFGGSTYLNPNICSRLLFEKSRTDSFEKLYNVQDWKEIESEEEMKKIISENEIEDSYLLFDDEKERTPSRLYQEVSTKVFVVKCDDDDDWWENDFELVWEIKEE